MWLEDQKIRLYKIEDRVELRDVKSSEWLKTLRKVSCYRAKLTVSLTKLYALKKKLFPQPTFFMFFVSIKTVLDKHGSSISSSERMQNAM